MNAKVQQFLDKLFASNPLNRLPAAYGGGRIFDPPVTGAARGDDPIVHVFKDVVGPEHLTPAEMWRQSGLAAGNPPSGQLRVLSIIFPYVDLIRKQSKNATELPAEIYSVGRNYANAFMDDVLEKTVAFFKGNGFRATSGMRSPAFQIIVKENPVQIYSVWSERHMAFAAGLGTFSLHEGFISDLGCNIRVTSVITDAPLAVTPRESDDPYANCLFYTSGKCQKCAARCPAGAISENGHDKVKCYLQLKEIEAKMTRRVGSILKPHVRVIEGREQTSYPVGCAFCQFDVPCMERNPLKQQS